MIDIIYCETGEILYTAIDLSNAHIWIRKNGYKTHNYCDGVIYVI